MKESIKKFMSLVVVLLSVNSVSAYDFEVDGVYYNVLSLSDLTAEITKGKTVYTFETFSIPSEVTYMGRTLNITKIGDSAFKNCKSLVSVTIPKSVTNIGNNAFDGCSSITSITIPESVINIGNYAFRDCSSITSITIPKGVTNIGYYTFSGCSSITSITVPESVTSIEKGTFSGCSSITSITIPENITSIGFYAFEDCSNISSITIPESVTDIGGAVFKNCDNLESINIYSNILQKKNIFGDFSNTFSGCSNINYFYISSSVNKIDDGIFSQDAINLKEIIIDDSEQPLYLGVAEQLSYSRMVGGYKMTYHYSGSFSKASFTSLEKVYLGRNLSYKESSDLSTWNYAPFSFYDFSYDSKIKEIYIGDYVTNLDGLEISKHRELEVLTIGKGLSKIPSLYYHSKLTSLTLTSEVPQAASEFTNTQYLNMKVYVPKGSLAAYQAADVWKNFWNLQEFDPTGINDAITNPHVAKEMKRYDAAGRAISSPQRGLNIIKMSDGTTRKIIVK